MPNHSSIKIIFDITRANSPFFFNMYVSATQWRNLFFCFRTEKIYENKIPQYICVIYFKRLKSHTYLIYHFQQYTLTGSLPWAEDLMGHARLLQQQNETSTALQRELEVFPSFIPKRRICNISVYFLALSHHKHDSSV